MGGGERELLGAIGAAARAQAVVFFSSTVAGWHSESWLGPQIEGLLTDWQPPREPPPSIFPGPAGEAVCFTDPLAGLGAAGAAVADQLQLVLQAGASLHLRPSPGLGPALLWLGLEQQADRERLGGLAQLSEQLLAQHLPLLQDCLEQLPGVFVAVAMDGTILYCNSLVCNLGYSPEELVGQPGAMLFAPGERERLRAELERRPQISRHEALMRNSDGKYLMADMMVSVIFDEQQRPHHIICIGRNLREVREREHHRRLEAVANLVSGVAHELNNPLMTVVGSAEMLTTMKLPDTAQRRAERVLAGARRCQEVVNELLRMKLKSSSSREEIDVAQLAQRSLKRLREEQGASQVTVEIRSPEQPLLIVGNVAELEQALVNLLKNALQAAGERDRPLVSVKLGHDEDFAQITICDNGPGMLTEVLDRAFEPFFTTREIGAGRGLGLSTALAIVQEHGGFIDLRTGSEGTEALVTLPMQSVEPL